MSTPLIATFVQVAVLPEYQAAMSPVWSVEVTLWATVIALVMRAISVPAEGSRSAAVRPADLVVGMGTSWSTWQPFVLRVKRMP